MPNPIEVLLQVLIEMLKFAVFALAAVVILTIGCAALMLALPMRLVQWAWRR